MRPSKPRILVLVTLALLATAAPAGAQTEREQARELFLEGRKLYNRKDYAAALTRFEQAAALYRSYKIELSIAFTLEKLDRPAEAARRYEQFLLQRPADSKKSVEEEVFAKLKRLRRTLAMVTVDTDIDGATVDIDGVTSHTTPLPHRLYLSPGSHTVTVKNGGRVVYSRELDLKQGQHVWVRPGRGAARSRPAATATGEQTWLTGGTLKKKPSRPFYTKWWFWTAVGAVVVGTTVAIAVGASGGDDWVPSGDSGTIDLRP